MATPSTLEELMECFRETTGKIHPAETEDNEPAIPLYKLAFNASLIKLMTATEDSSSEPASHPLTCTQLLSSLLLEFLSRQHTNLDLAQVNNISDLPTEVVQTLKKLCNFAYTNSLEARYTFELDDLESYKISIPADSLGLLQQVQIPGIFGSKLRYAFLHHCLQEFLAALYLADLPRRRMVEGIGELANQRVPSFILPAFAGITRLKNRDVLKALIGIFQELNYLTPNLDIKYKAPTDPQMILLLLLCIHESQRSDLCQVIADKVRQHVGSRSFVNFDFNDTQLMPVDCNAVGYFISKLSSGNFYASFELCYLSDEDTEILMKPLLNIRNTDALALLQLNGNRITHIGTASICKVIRSSSIMCLLSLKGNWIPPETDISACLRSLVEALSTNNSVKVLNIESNHLMSEHIYYLILMVVFCNNLTTLQLGINNIASALPLFAVSLERNTSLKELGIQCCCITNESLVMLGRSLRKNKTLERLNVCDNPFSATDTLPSFLSQLRGGSCIRELTITSSQEVCPNQASLLQKINAERLEYGTEPLQIIYKPPNIMIQRFIAEFGSSPSERKAVMERLYSSFLVNKQLQLQPDSKCKRQF